jgi:hypothetical protein
VHFGKIAIGAPTLAGLLGTVTGLFDSAGLVANVGIALIRADALLCGGGGVSIPVSGGAR